jgi:hypothetical protein
MPENFYYILKEFLLPYRIILGIFWYTLLNFYLMWTLYITTSLFSSSGDDINIRPISFDHIFGFIIYHIESSLHGMIFPFRNHIWTISNNMSLIHVVCTLGSLWKGEISHHIPLLIEIIAMSWSSFYSSSTSVSTSTYLTSPNSSSSFIDPEWRLVQSVYKCI